MKAVFAVFLCACAWKDLKEKEIPPIFFCGRCSGRSYMGGRRSRDRGMERGRTGV